MSRWLCVLPSGLLSNLLGNLAMKILYSCVCTWVVIIKTIIMCWLLLIDGRAILSAWYAIMCSFSRISLWDCLVVQGGLWMWWPNDVIHMNIHLLFLLGRFLFLGTCTFEPRWCRVLAFLCLSSAVIWSLLLVVSLSLLSQLSVF